MCIQFVQARTKIKQEKTLGCICILKMDKQLILICILLCGITGFEIELLMNVAKSCLPYESFREFHLIFKQSYFSDDELIDNIKMYQNSLFIGFSSR
jgi:hypothetical protein